MPHMSDVMDLLEETVYPLSVLVTFSNSFTVESLEAFQDLLERVKQAVAEHKILKVGHLART